MAKTINGAVADEVVYTSFPIVEKQEGPDGTLYVYGRATTPEVDTDDQVVDSAFSGRALKEWLAVAPALRVQHNGLRDPAGSGVKVEVDRDGDGAHWIKAAVDEPKAAHLVRKGHLRAFSVGIAKPVIERDMTGKARNGVIKGGKIVEVSLVDSPANRSCFLELAKAASDGSAEFTGKMVGDEDDFLAKMQADDADPDGGDADDDAPDPDDDDADDDSADEAGDSDDEDDAEKAYARAVQAHKAAEPIGGHSTGTEFLAKAAAWRRWDAERDELGLDGTSAGFATWLGKRRMDPDVGGGVDRDQIPDADHVDPKGRRFPIHSPKDVSDAVNSYGRAKPLIPMRKFRRALTAIARRKGPDFEAQLPESWKAPDTATKDITLTDPNPAGLVPYNLQGGEKPRKRKRDMAEADVAKGAKDCPECGKDYDADSKMRTCESCGSKLPKAKVEKSAVDELQAAIERLASANPETMIALSSAVEKSKGDRMVPADVKPAGEHREPDGSAVEALEHDAGMHTTPDAKPDDIPASVKSDGKPTDADEPAFPGAAPAFGSKSTTAYQVQRMHDATCAAHGWDAVAAEYPALKSVSDAIVPGWYAEQVQDAANKGDMAVVAALAPLAQDADVVAKGLVDPAVLADARAMLHKSFTDMYPTVSGLKPGAPPQPGQFQRPYISAGHAPLSAGTGGRPSAVPPSTHVPEPEDFRRPLITAGHEAESPADKGNNLVTPSVSSGAARHYYTNASKEAARNAMQAMHDHIAVTFPDMCPMAPSRAVMPPDNGASNVPKAVKPLEVPKAPGEKDMVAEVQKWAERAEKAALATQPTVDIDAIVDAAVTKALAVADERHTKADKKQRKLIKQLQEENDRLGAMPDPAQAPLRGVVSKAATVDKPAPVEKTVSLLEKAHAEHEAQQAEYIEHLRKMAGSDNPGMAEKAERALAEVLDAN